MSKYMIVFDEWDRALVEGTLADKVEQLREDNDAVNNRLAGVLDTINNPVPFPEPDVSRETSQEEMPLIVQLMQASHNATTNTTQAVIDSMQQELDKRLATIELIRETIRELYSHPWNPRSYAVLAALHPDRHDIAARVNSITRVRRMGVR